MSQTGLDLQMSQMFEMFESDRRTECLMTGLDV